MLGMRNQMFSEFDQLLALITQPTIVSIALALCLLVVMQLFWELARWRAVANAALTVRAGHRVKLFRAAAPRAGAREGAGDRIPGDRIPGSPAGVDHAS